jgi:hypothetical protein
MFFIKFNFGFEIFIFRCAIFFLHIASTSDITPGFIKNILKIVDKRKLFLFVFFFLCFSNAAIRFLLNASSD